MRDHRLLYLERLSDRDLEILCRTVEAAEGAAELRAALERSPEALGDLLSSPRLFGAVFDQKGETVEIGMTPSFIFGVLVYAAARELSAASYVPEWVGAGQRLPVFAASALSEFVEDGVRRYFLIELMASFTRIASGSIWVKTRRGYRRKKYSELNPVRLAEMVEGLPREQRPAGYRRLGDVALFLSGVFPDHTARHPVGEVARSRLARSAGLDPNDEIDSIDDVRLFETLGTSWYDRAADMTQANMGVAPGYLKDVATHFADARRFLNYVADTYLHRFETGLMHPAAS